MPRPSRSRSSRNQPTQALDASELLGLLIDTARAAFVHGSVAKREDTATSDIDVMVISDRLTYADLFAVLEEATGRLGRKVNPTVYAPAELARRVRQGNAFVRRVLAQPKIWLIGGERDLASWTMLIRHPRALP